MINRLLEDERRSIETNLLIVLIACKELEPEASMKHRPFMKMWAQGNERRNPKRLSQTNTHLKMKVIGNLKRQDSLACNPTMVAIYALTRTAS